MTHRREIVSLQGIRKSYPMVSGTVDALRGVDLTIMEGELVAIMGRSGSGKSTLMHIIGCLDQPTEGVYRLDGSDVASKSDEELSLLRAQEIGFVFQAFNLIPQLTVYENVEIPFLYQSQASGAKKERIVHALTRVGLKDRMDHKPSELSGGEMQRVAIARALVIDPLLILADEPTGNLDSANGERILHLFSELHEQGVTIVLVTHDESVGNYCERIVRMRDGAIVSDTTKREEETKVEEVEVCLST